MVDVHPLLALPLDELLARARAKRHWLVSAVSGAKVGTWAVAAHTDVFCAAISRV